MRMHVCTNLSRVTFEKCRLGSVNSVSRKAKAVSEAPTTTMRALRRERNGREARNRRVRYDTVKITEHEKHR